jgi:hypothetical protein
VPLSGADRVTGLGGSVYVSHETNVVTRVDVRTLEVTGRVKVARNPVVRRIPGGPSPIVVLPAFGHVRVSHTIANSVSRM